MKTNETNVVIVGAGPVGLATALFLHERGIDPVVAETMPRGCSHSQALALHPASLELLDSVGVLGDVVAGALAIQTLAIYSAHGKVCAVPILGPGNRRGYLAVLGQDVLERALAERLKRRGVRVWWNHRYARSTPAAEGVMVELDELEQRMVGYAVAHLDWMLRRTSTLATRFLVGADGHESLVRRHAGIEFPAVAPAEHFAVFEFQTRGPLPDEIAIVLHDEGVGVFWPLPDGRARWSFEIDAREFPDARREKEREAVQALGAGLYPVIQENFIRRLLEERAPWFHAPIDHVYWRIAVRFERRLAETFGREPVWLAGDAAHLTGPVGIQSMNVGLIEASRLAEALAQALAGGRAAAEIEAFDAVCRAEWRRLLGLSVRVEATAEAPPEIRRFKDRLLACLPASGETLVVLARQLGLRLIPSSALAAIPS